MQRKYTSYIWVAVCNLDEYQWGCGVTTKHRRWFWWTLLFYISRYQWAVFILCSASPTPRPCSPPHSLFQWHCLLHEPNARMLSANFCRHWGRVEHPFISGKQTCPITSSGSWCWYGGQEVGGNQHLFFLTTHSVICVRTNMDTFEPICCLCNDLW